MDYSIYLVLFIWTAKDEKGKELKEESASLREKLNKKEMELSELQAN